MADKEEEKKPVTPPTRMERMKYNQYVRKTTLNGGTPVSLETWVRTQRGGK